MRSLLSHMPVKEYLIKDTTNTPKNEKAIYVHRLWNIIQFSGVDTALHLVLSARVIGTSHTQISMGQYFGTSWIIIWFGLSSLIFSLRFPVSIKWNIILLFLMIYDLIKPSSQKRGIFMHFMLFINLKYIISK